LPKGAHHFSTSRPVSKNQRAYQLIGRIVDIKVDGIMAQVTLSIGASKITSVITADAVRELGWKRDRSLLPSSSPLKS